MNRRKFLKTLGKGLIGIGLFASSPVSAVRAFEFVSKGNDEKPKPVHKKSKAYAPSEINERGDTLIPLKCYDINTDSMVYGLAPKGKVDELLKIGWVRHVEP